MKKYSNYFLIGVFVLVNSLMLPAQHHYNIRLLLSETASVDKICYDVQLASADAVDFNLAGQNYRLFYDGAKLTFNEEASQNLLPETKYANLVIKDNVHNRDASGAGPLAFDHHLSFLNIGNDLNDESNGGIILPASGEWISTANICFDIVSSENQLNNNDYGIFWARPALTQSYATAYVEVAKWIAPHVTIPAKAAAYYDQEINTATVEQAWENKLKVYPVPTTDKVFIDFVGSEELVLQLYSTNGQLILEDKYPAYTETHSISMWNLGSGLYYLKLSSKGKQIIKQIEKIQ